MRATAGTLALVAMTTVVLSGCGGPPFEELGTVPEYTTVKTDDISRPNAVRYRLEVLVANAGLSKADLETVAKAFPDKDPSPRYDPLPPRPWDVTQDMMQGGSKKEKK